MELNLQAIAEKFNAWRPLKYVAAYIKKQDKLFISVLNGRGVSSEVGIINYNKPLNDWEVLLDKSVPNDTIRRLQGIIEELMPTPTGSVSIYFRDFKGDPFKPAGSGVLSYRGDHPKDETLDYLRDNSVKGENNPVKPAHYQNGEHDILYYLGYIIGNDEAAGFMVGNIIKYVCRYKQKNGIEDLKKAQEYLKRLIASEEHKQK